MITKIIKNFLNKEKCKFENIFYCFVLNDMLIEKYLKVRIIMTVLTLSSLFYLKQKSSNAQMVNDGVEITSIPEDHENIEQSVRAKFKPKNPPEQEIEEDFFLKKNPKLLRMKRNYDNKLRKFIESLKDVRFFLPINIFN